MSWPINGGVVQTIWMESSRVSRAEAQEQARSEATAQSMHFRYQWYKCTLFRGNLLERKGNFHYSIIIPLIHIILVFNCDVVLDIKCCFSAAHLLRWFALPQTTFLYPKLWWMCVPIKRITLAQYSSQCLSCFPVVQWMGRIPGQYMRRQWRWLHLQQCN